MAKKLKAWLRKNILTPDPTDYMAVPVTNGSVGIKEIVDELQKEGMELKRETAIDVISRFVRKTADMVADGHNANIDIVYIRPVIKGPFYGKTWNPEVNSLVASVSQGNTLRIAMADTSVEILGEQANPLDVYSVTDKSTGNTEGLLTKGRNAEIKGSYLKIKGDDPSCGITFTNMSTKEVTKLEAADIVFNEPSRLLIFVPATLAAGEYELTITTQYSGGNTSLKQPRSVTFGIPVIVN